MKKNRIVPLIEVKRMVSNDCGQVSGLYKNKSPVVSGGIAQKSTVTGEDI